MEPGEAKTILPAGVFLFSPEGAAQVLPLKDALVVDDYEPLRRVVSSTLQATGYRVFEAATAHEALVILTSRQISLLVCDLCLNEQSNGMTLIEDAVRTYPGLRAILMSGSLRSGQKTGGDFSVISKPFAPQELLELIEGLSSQDRSSSVSG